MDIIGVSNVCLTLGKTEILKHINVSFEEGKIHGLIGRNGSGKTMLMKCICGFIKPTSGEIIVAGKKPWGVCQDFDVKVDLFIPCAMQNDVHMADAENIVASGCKFYCEGANMPTTLEATQYLQENGVIFAPGKAANAGGVATSALEMSQNSERLSWTFEEVDAKLKNIMVNICHNMDDAAKRYGMEGNYVAGANIAGFEKVVDAMTAQGIV